MGYVLETFARIRARKSCLSLSIIVTVLCFRVWTWPLYDTIFNNDYIDSHLLIINNCLGEIAHHRSSFCLSLTCFHKVLLIKNYRRLLKLTTVFQKIYFHFIYVLQSVLTVLLVWTGSWYILFEISLNIFNMYLTCI